MLDAFFKGAGGGGGFRGAKCKTLLKLSIPRIKLLRNRRELQLRQMRRDIAKLLEAGQEATARIRVEHIIREENMMAAQEILELFCELIAVRLPIIETQKECPIDLKEPISSICFAAPRCSDLPELMQVQMMFATKYGKEFVAAATELMPDCGVNRQIIELLSIRAPPVDAKMKLLKEIAEEHEIDWDPSATETEYLKPHEDLLNGPSFFSGSTLPLPKEKHEEALSASAAEHPDEDYDRSDTGFESLDLPEVPKAAIRPPSDTPATPDIGTHVQSSQPTFHEFSNMQNSQPSSHEFSNMQSSQPSSHEFSNIQSSPPASHEFSNMQSSQPSSHEFSNIQSSPPASHEFSIAQSSQPVSHEFMNPSDLEENPTAFMTQPKGSEHISTPFAQLNMPVSPNEKKHFVPLASPPPFAVPSPVEKNESIPSPSPSPPVKPTNQEMLRTIHEVTPPPITTDYLFSKQPEQLHSTSTENIANVDLDDVLSAAQTAAQTAERAASAARAAANLAQLRIADLKKNSKAYENYSDGVQKESHPQSEVTQKPVFHHQDSFSNDTQGYVPSHLPHSSPSMGDDPYFSYPNLFSSKP